MSMSSTGSAFELRRLDSDTPLVSLPSSRGRRSLPASLRSDLEARGGDRVRNFVGPLGDRDRVLDLVGDWSR